MRESVTWCRRIVGAVSMVALSVSVNGQTVLGTIQGTISDETGATLPGVTVTVTSPALQVPQLVKTSEAGGEYQFSELPPGVYRVSYELTGFGTLVREEIRITSGFSARVNVVLKVSSVSESVTVSGQSPLVDVTNTRGSTTVSK